MAAALPRRPPVELILRKAAAQSEDVIRALALVRERQAAKLARGYAAVRAPAQSPASGPANGTGGSDIDPLEASGTCLVGDIESSSSAIRTPTSPLNSSTASEARRVTAAALCVPATTRLSAEGAPAPSDAEHSARLPCVLRARPAATLNGALHPAVPEKHEPRVTEDSEGIAAGRRMAADVAAGAAIAPAAARSEQQPNTELVRVCARRLRAARQDLRLLRTECSIMMGRTEAALAALADGARAALARSLAEQGRLAAQVAAGSALAAGLEARLLRRDAAVAALGGRLADAESRLAERGLQVTRLREHAQQRECAWSIPCPCAVYGSAAARHRRSSRPRLSYASFALHAPNLCSSRRACGSQGLRPRRSPPAPAAACRSERRCGRQRQPRALHSPLATAAIP